jgi:hypothetical protein
MFDDHVGVKGKAETNTNPKEKTNPRVQQKAHIANGTLKRGIHDE